MEVSILLSSCSDLLRLLTSFLLICSYCLAVWVIFELQWDAFLFLDCPPWAYSPLLAYRSPSIWWSRSWAFPRTASGGVSPYRRGLSWLINLCDYCDKKSIANRLNDLEKEKQPVRSQKTEPGQVPRASPSGILGPWNRGTERGTQLHQKGKEKLKELSYHQDRGHQRQQGKLLRKGD